MESAKGKIPQVSIEKLIANLPVMFFSCRVDSSNKKFFFDFVSDGCIFLTGYLPNDLTCGKIDLNTIIHNKDLTRLFNQYTIFINSNKSDIIIETEIRIICKENKTKRAIFRATMYRLPNEPYILMNGIILSISSPKDKNTELKKYAAAIQHVPDSILITDASGLIKYVNPAFERITGYSSSEIIGKTPRILKSGIHDVSFYSELWRTIISGKVWTGRIVNRKKNGALYTEDASIAPIFDENEKILEFVAIKKDISRELMIEEQLTNAQKMEAIGTLAGGIAHDFNNILVPIIGYSELLKDDFQEGTRHNRFINEILKGSLRAKALISQILTFSRKSSHEMLPILVQDVLNEAVAFSSATLPSTISIRTNINLKCKPVMGNYSQVHQLVMNLITNSLHAMEENGGLLTVALDEIYTDDFKLGNTQDLKPGRYALVEISDNGIGIDNNIAGKIFDPYFTTKPQGKGTGIGLAVVNGIIKNHGGKINFRSKNGQGTSFFVYFPCLSSATQVSSNTNNNLLPTGSEHILVVDDEEAVCMMIGHMLDRMGYKVSTTSNSADALDMLKANPFGYDLVLTDMTMPNMTGETLYFEIKKIRKNIPVIICSGYSKHMDEDKARFIGIDGFLNKPLQNSELSSKIREVLNSNSNLK